ncbi:MAG: glycine cleavage system protein H [Bacteroidales bacterium]
MEGFNYYNIFDTKGIEYIAIIAFFIILIPFWIILNKSEEIKNKIKEVFSILTFDTLKIPQGIFYSKNHTWAYLEKSGDASVGIDDFLIHSTGDVKLHILKNSNDLISKGDLITEIIKDDKILKIFSPISGKIVKSNVQLDNEPTLLNIDPYGKGWIYKIKPSKWIDETQTLFLAEDATNWSKSEMQRFKDFMALSTKKYSNENNLAILQDGGELVDHPLSELSRNVWLDFQENFLKPKD